MSISHARTPTAIILACVLAAGLALAPAAQAQSTDYHPDAEARTFQNSDGGWTAATEYTNPLCALEPLTCPGVTNRHVESGGAGGTGDGYLTSELSGLTSTLTSTLTIWTSPPFEYQGVDGEEPGSIRFTLDRQFDVQALLDLMLLDEAHFSVHLDHVDPGDPDTMAGPSVTIVDQHAIENIPSWTGIGSVPVDPDQLTLGQSYRIRIVTELEMLLGVIPDASFDYDNVRLRAFVTDDPDGPPPPPPPPPPPNGTPPTGGGAACNAKRMNRILGTNGNDRLVGTAGPDSIWGFFGDDVLIGRAGNDCLFGGPGNDVLRGGPGNDRLFGGGGHDRIFGGPGNDVILTGPGNVRVNAGPGRDRVVILGRGNKRVTATRGRNRIRCRGRHRQGRSTIVVNRQSRVDRPCRRAHRVVVR